MFICWIWTNLLNKELPGPKMHGENRMGVRQRNNFMMDEPALYWIFRNFSWKITSPSFRVVLERPTLTRITENWEQVKTSPQLECWNTGMMGVGFRFDSVPSEAMPQRWVFLAWRGLCGNELIALFVLTIKIVMDNILLNNQYSIIPIFQYSMMRQKPGP